MRKPGMVFDYDAIRDNGESTVLVVVPQQMVQPYWQWHVMYVLDTQPVMILSLILNQLQKPMQGAAATTADCLQPSYNVIHWSQLNVLT